MATNEREIVKKKLKKDLIGFTVCVAIVGVTFYYAPVITMIGVAVAVVIHILQTL